MELALCLAALVMGPCLYQLARARRNTYAFFDGFVLVGVGGLVLVEILPRSFQEIGLAALPVAVAGFLFPHIVEHWLDRFPIWLIVAGLVLHQILDGAALQSVEVEGHEHTLSLLGIAVILHQVPKGFLLWDVARKASGVRAAVLVIAGLLAATATGFYAGTAFLESAWVSCFQAFVAGGLLHVVIEHVSVGAGGKPRSSEALASGCGALAALALFVGIPHAHFIEPPGAGAIGFREAFLRLALDSAPPVLLGFLVAGMVQAFVPARGLGLLRGGSRLSEALRGIVFGLPLPICSCGVTPIYHALVRRGVPAAAAVSFLIATPEIGLDSFFLSLRLLGWQITLLRLAMAFAVALISGWLLAGIYGKVLADPDLPPEPLKEENEGRTPIEKLRQAVRIGFGELVDHVGVWLIAGLAVAALIEPYVDARWFSGLPGGLDVVLFALLGLPVYVCASGATPLAAALLAKGVSPGAILAFLITGPTTNVTTLGVLARLHGLRRASALPIAVFVLSVLAGFGVNAVLVHGEGPAPSPAADGAASPLDAASAIALAVIIALSILRLGPRRFAGKLAADAGLSILGSHRHGPHEGACEDDDGPAGHAHGAPRSRAGAGAGGAS
jgi:uncharacterized membrane protein YraQ (UPF0718 family)